MVVLSIENFNNAKLINENLVCQLTNYYSNIRKAVKCTFKEFNIEVDKNLFKIKNCQPLEHPITIDTIFNILDLQICDESCANQNGKISKSDYEKAKTIIEDIVSGNHSIQIHCESTINFRSSILLDLMILFTDPLGRDLLFQLSDKKNNVVIIETKDTNSLFVEPILFIRNLECMIGILWNEKSNQFSFMVLPRFIALAHEFMHAQHISLFGRNRINQLNNMSSSLNVHFGKMAEQVVITGDANGLLPQQSITEQNITSSFRLLPRNTHKAICETPTHPLLEVRKDLLMKAIQFGVSEDFIKELINTQKNPYNFALEHAIKKNNELFVQFLLDNHCNLDLPNESGELPFHVAVRCGSLSIVQCLFKKEQIDLQNANQDTPLHLAIKNHRDDIVDYLLAQGCRTDLPSEGGIYPIHLAVLNGSSNLIDKLLEHGSPLDPPNNFGQTPLFMAICVPQSNGLVKHLLSKGAKVDAVNAMGMQPIHLAVMQGSAEMVQVLLEYNASIEAENKNGSTPLALAVQFGHHHIIPILQ